MFVAAKSLLLEKEGAPNTGLGAPVNTETAPPRAGHEVIQILILLAGILSGPPLVEIAQADTIQPSFPVAGYSTTTEGLIARYASEFDVSGPLLAEVIHCESRGLETAIGDHGQSYGIAQIFLPAHPEISKRQALDKEFSIRYMAEQFSKGRASMWTCYRNL